MPRVGTEKLLVLAQEIQCTWHFFRKQREAGRGPRTKVMFHVQIHLIYYHSTGYREPRMNTNHC